MVKFWHLSKNVLDIPVTIVKDVQLNRDVLYAFDLLIDPESDTLVYNTLTSQVQQYTFKGLSQIVEFKQQPIQVNSQPQTKPDTEEGVSSTAKPSSQHQDTPPVNIVTIANSTFTGEVLYDMDGNPKAIVNIVRS